MTSERTFDRAIKFDERSRNYPIRPLLAEVKDHRPRSYTWNVYDVLDQGSEGACVGFGWAHELMARPVVVKGLTNEAALTIYHRAKKDDEWAGEDYEGTSVLAGAKVIQNMEHMDEYRWIFADAQEIITTLAYFGPIVCGVNWHEGMFEPDEEGHIFPTGEILGGHCILANGIMFSRHSPMLSRVKFVNSWGPDWGVGGSCYMYLTDFVELVKDNGELCVPVRRHQAK